MKKHWLNLLIIVFTTLTSFSDARERFPLLFVSGSETNHNYVFRFLPTGELVTTGQVIDYSGSANGVSPDSRFIWFGWQGEITPYGWITATGRTLPNSGVIYTPNGQMLIAEDGSICRAYPDGSIESTLNVYNRGLYYISPRGDIHIRPSTDSYDGLDPNGNSWVVERIDYNTFNLYTIQKVYDPPPAQYGNSYLAVFTPEGDYVALSHNFDEVVVYPILSNGLLDTTRRIALPSVSGFVALAITPDGNYIYVSRLSHNEIAVLRRIPDAGFEDTGWRTSLEIEPTIIRVSPDGKFLVVEYHTLGYFYDHIKVYAIQFDGSLVETFDLPFEEMFGDGGLDGLEFAYPLGPTKVESFQWQLYQ